MPEFRAARASEGALPSTAELAALTQFYQSDILPNLPEAGRPLSAGPLLPTDPQGERLQQRYIAANPHPQGKRDLFEGPSAAANAYDAVHKTYHAHFLDMMRDLGLYDIFLIDDKTGDVLYTVEKEIDFATNLTTGPYRNSGLAQAFRAVRDAPADQNGVVFVDFDHYVPSFGAPAAFLAAPVFHNGDRVGVIVGQVSIDEMNAALTSSGDWVNEGLGISGEVYLVGADGFARSDSRFLIEDKPGYLDQLTKLGVEPSEITAIAQSGHSVLNQHFATLAVERAQSGETGADTIRDYRGIEVLSAYAPIDFGGHRWAIIAEKDVAEALGPLHDLRRVILIATGAIAMAITIFALISARAFVSPLLRLQLGVERLSSGDTQFKVPVKGNDEFATLATAFNGMLSEIVRRNGIIESKTAEYEKLLRNVLPDTVADRFNGGELIVADTFENVSIIYAVIVGLDVIQRDHSANDIIRLLNELIDLFDESAERHGVEKVKTIGDAYLAACGLSTPRLDHRQRAAAFADEIQSILRRFNEAKGLHLTLSIGLANGEVDAGIVGRKRFVYEILGECVSEARRLALSGNESKIHMSAAMGAALLAHDQDEAKRG
ncbi:MAG: adenylate/guanylate cyclase domain-containing protein [Pseudomonadota bacterium]